MLASQVINLAKTTELKQLEVKKDNIAIIGFINLGLLELYKRFPLQIEEAVLEIQDAKTLYTLDGNDSDVTMGTTENFLVVTDAYTPSIINDDYPDVELHINDENEPTGIMTPTFNTIKILKDLTDAEKGYGQDTLLTITYRTGIDFITKTTDTFPLPPALLEALLHYIGYRGHVGMNAGIKEENNTHYIRFDASCTRVLNLGLIVPDDMENYKFYQRGFV